MKPGVYTPVQLEELLKELHSIIEHSADSILSDSEQIVSQIANRILLLEEPTPFDATHNADFAFAQCCYVVCRLLKPAVVVETGVAYGVTSSFILHALETNGKGVLYSIDLPPLARDADKFVGVLVPAELRHRWKLFRGVNKRVLPSLLKELGRVDLFLHDSLHTYDNMKFELRRIVPYLSRPGVVISDDIHGNRAFLEWVLERRPDFWAAVREKSKDGIFGIAVFSE